MTCACNFPVDPWATALCSWCAHNSCRDKAWYMPPSVSYLCYASAKYHISLSFLLELCLACPFMSYCIASALSSLKSLSKYRHLCCHEFTCTVTDDGLQAYDISISSLPIFACWNAANLVERKASKLFEFYGGMPAAQYFLIQEYGIYPFKQVVFSTTKNQLRDCCWSLNKKMADSCLLVLLEILVLIRKLEILIINVEFPVVKLRLVVMIFGLSLIKVWWYSCTKLMNVAETRMLFPLLCQWLDISLNIRLVSIWL